MYKYKVWDAETEDAQHAKTYEAETVREAALFFARQDSQGYAAGRYHASDGSIIKDVARNGHTLVVADMHGNMFKVNVAVYAYHPMYDAHVVTLIGG